MRRATVLAAAAAFLMACGGSGVPADTPDPRQSIYDVLLQQARRDVSGDADRNCNPDYQQLVIDMVDASQGEKALLQLALADACIEAGEWTGVSYSPYHADAPP